MKVSERIETHINIGCYYGIKVNIKKKAKFITSNRNCERAEGEVRYVYHFIANIGF